jgi:hypothetical protein
MTQRVGEPGGGKVWSTPSRHTISSRSVSTLTPEFSISIIRSTLNPACSAATATFQWPWSTMVSPWNPSPPDDCVRESHESSGRYVTPVTAHCDKGERPPQRKQEATWPRNSVKNASNPTRVGSAATTIEANAAKLPTPAKGNHHRLRHPESQELNCHIADGTSSGAVVGAKVLPLPQFHFPMRVEFVPRGERTDRYPDLLRSRQFESGESDSLLALCRDTSGESSLGPLS